jgi:hypothetical protein
MSSIKATARLAGVVYFVFMIVAILGEFVIPSFTVPGDPAATASKITAGEATYRLDILTAFVTLIIFIFLVVVLYKLFADVDKTQAMLMVLLVSIGVAVSLATLLIKFVPLVLLSGADYLSAAFNEPQLEALTLGVLGVHRSATAFSMTFWGLWLFPFGILVIKSGFIPRIFGYLLLVAGFAYLATSVVSIGLPEYRQAVARVMTPLYIGEVPIIFWLLIKGARMPQPEARPAVVA